MNRSNARKLPMIAITILVLGAAIFSILLYIMPGRYRLYQTSLFDQAEEVPLNPMMGFAPDARSPEDCEDTTLVLIDLDWKDWEPRPGFYDRENLEKTYHINDYKKRGVCGVLRFHCKAPDDGQKRDLGDAIRALAAYFSDTSFVRYVETDEIGRKHVSAFQEYFPGALVTAPSDYRKTKEKGCGLYFNHLGDRLLHEEDRKKVTYTGFWKKAPSAGGLSYTEDRKWLLKENLSQVLQEIRDDHITYISDNCPNYRQQKKNGSRMILRTLGYCLYISRLQTTVNFRKDTVALQFTFRNTGVAPCYADWPVKMTVYDHKMRPIHKVVLPVKLRDLQPEKDCQVTGEFPYSSYLTRGYSIGIRICNPDHEEEFITLAQKIVKPDDKGEHILYSYSPSDNKKKVSIGHPDSYQVSMIDLLCDLSYYAKGKNQDFAMITNGGYRLYMPEYNKNEESLMRLTSAMDGALTESLFYGWEDMDNYPTPDKESEEMQKAVKLEKKAGMAVFNIEYCSNKEIRKKSANKCRKTGSVWYNALDRELSKVPELANYRKNKKNCRELSDVKSFIALLNPVEYKTKEDYLNAIRDTDYDMVFIDLYYHGKPLSKKEVASLKVKKNGKRRMICAYMSVGEAEDYRDYWQESWNQDLPPWVCEVNEKWAGNYKVMYWTKSWRDILFGSRDSYLDKILNAGFDGVYLDVVDAYEYFEDLQE